MEDLLIGTVLVLAAVLFLLFFTGIVMVCVRVLLGLVRLGLGLPPPKSGMLGG